MKIHYLKSHDDIGYRNFFDIFRDEYDNKLDMMDEPERFDFINQKMHDHDTHSVLMVFESKNYIIFESDKHYNLFLLKYS